MSSILAKRMRGYVVPTSAEFCPNTILNRKYCLRSGILFASQFEVCFGLLSVLGIETESVCARRLAAIKLDRPSTS